MCKTYSLTIMRLDHIIIWCIAGSICTCQQRNHFLVLPDFAWALENPSSAVRTSTPACVGYRLNQLANRLYNGYISDISQMTHFSLQQLQGKPTQTVIYTRASIVDCYCQEQYSILTLYCIALLFCYMYLPGIATPAGHTLTAAGLLIIQGISLSCNIYCWVAAAKVL